MPSLLGLYVPHSILYHHRSQLKNISKDINHIHKVYKNTREMSLKTTKTRSHLTDCILFIFAFSVFSHHRFLPYFPIPNFQTTQRAKKIYFCTISRLKIESSRESESHNHKYNHHHRNSCIANNLSNTNLPSALIVCGRRAGIFSDLPIPSFYANQYQFGNRRARYLLVG